MNFHPNCFVCAKCNKNLGGEQFIPFEDKVYDMKCYKEEHAKVCAQCGGYIDGQFYEVEGKNIHAKCLDRFKKQHGY